MNFSSEIFTTDGSNISSYLFHSGAEVENTFYGIPVLYLLSAVVVSPINSYVIWLIVTGTGNGLAAEFFSLNLNVFEVLICVQSVFIFISYKFKMIWIVVCFLDGLAFTGRPLFQCLICVERYLAVVHPVIFLKFKSLRYRVICSVITCMSSLVSGGVNMFLMPLYMLNFFIFLFIQFLLFLFTQLFCCLAVLRALKQSGPGERGRERREENHMKRRAFYFILITTMSTVILYVPFIILLALFGSAQPADTVFFIILICFTLVGLVQPLLFLYRVRKLPCLKY